MKSTVVVLGATGQVGLFAIDTLLRADRQVIAVTRDAPSGSETAIRGIRRLDMSGLVEWIDTRKPVPANGVALLSCGPIALAQQLLEPETGTGFDPWERVVVVGTTSLVSKRTSDDAGERSEIEGIARALQSIKSRCRDSNIPLAVLHPTLIYGCGMDHNLSRLYRFIHSKGFAPVARNASGRRQPLHVADLAETIVRAIEASPPESLESPVCGGSIVSYEEMVVSLFEPAIRSLRLLRVPGFAAGLAAKLSGLLPGTRRVSAEMFRRQGRDLVFDDSAARERLKHQPRPFAPGRADFRLPADVDGIRRALLAG